MSAPPSTTGELPATITVQELAAATRQSERTIQRHCSARPPRLPAIRAAGTRTRWLILTASLNPAIRALLAGMGVSS